MEGLRNVREDRLVVPRVGDDECRLTVSAVIADPLHRLRKNHSIVFANPV